MFNTSKKVYRQVVHHLQAEEHACSTLRTGMQNRQRIKAAGSREGTGHCKFLVEQSLLHTRSGKVVYEIQ
jgi:hypothetical protein